MHWSCVVEKDGEIIYQQEGEMSDPFSALAHQTTLVPEQPDARVSCTVQRSLAYGEVKVSYNLTVSCPQTKPHMDYAAENLFALATVYVNNSMQYFVPGIDPLRVPVPSLPYPR